MAKTATVDLTPAEKDALVGGPHGDPYPIPSESDFDEGPAPGRLAADDLEAMARRLIALDRLKVGYLADFTIRVIWMKSGGSSGGKPVFATVQLASADDKFFAIERAEDLEDDETPFDAKIRLAADNLRAAKATRWNVGYELAGRLCQLGLQVTKKTGAKRLITVAPDASYSFAQMDVFGPQSPEIKRQFFDVKQQQFEWAQTLSEADFAAEDDEEEGDYDPSIDPPAGVESEAGPVDGGAPDAEWAEPFDVDALAEELGETTWAERFGSGDDDEDAAVREAGRRIDEHNTLVRANFPKEFAESDICAACGLFVFDHDPEVCQGGTPETREGHRQKSLKNRGWAGDAVFESGPPTPPGTHSEPLNASAAKSPNGTNDPETGEARFFPKTLAAVDAKAKSVRANFPKEFADSDLCSACGLHVFDHDPEVCQGGTPETRKRRSRKIARNSQQIQGEAQAPDPEGLDISGEDIALGLYSPSGDEPPPGVGTLDDYLAAVAAESEAGIGYVSSNGTNGNHDRDDVAGILCDPDAVMRVLSGHGWKIAFRGSVGEAMGFYINPETDAPYDTGDVEAEFRSTLSGKGGA